jgi:colicin import membrane protein
MVFRTPRSLPGSRQAVVYAVLVHIVLLTVVVIGVRWQSRPPAPARIIQAQSMNDAEARKQLERRKREERLQAEQEAKKQNERKERERKATEEKRRAEQAKAAEAKRQAQEKRKAAETEKKRKEQERLVAAKRKKEAEERRRAAEKSLKEQLASEEQERKDRAEAEKRRAEQAARTQTELDQYKGLIRQKVESNWVRPVGWSKDMRCIVRVRLSPTGEVLQATVVRPSGNPPFDRSVENAVYKASPLPLPGDKELYNHFRELDLEFHPEGMT